MTDLLVLGGVVFVVNLLPAFGPPTWTVLVFLRFNLDVAAVPLVLVGALSAAAGRLVLATGARRLSSRLSAKRRAGLDAARDALQHSRLGTAAGLGLFALSPLPSAQLFVAAGLARVRLLELTAAFFAGRLVSYALYVGAASVARDNFGDVLSEALTSPLGVALQLAMLAGLVALVRVDWAQILQRRAARRGLPAPPAGSQSS